MIKKIRLKNFQIWKDLEVRLSPTVTWIVGESDKGKTAIFRAVRWVATNRPVKKKFIRRGQSACIVTVYTDQDKITRKKTPKANLYFVNGKRLSAVGTKVPKEVERTLRLGPINFQNQLDGPYWLTLAPGQVAKELNKLADLSALDRLQAVAARTVREAKTRQEVVRKQYAEAKKQVKSLAWAEECYQDWKRVREKRKQKDGAKARYLGLKKEIQELRSLQTLKDPKPDFLKVEAVRIKADKAAEELRTLEMYLDERKQLVEKLERIEAEQKGLESQISQTGRCPTCGQKWKRNTDPSPSPEAISTFP